MMKVLKKSKTKHNKTKHNKKRHNKTRHNNKSRRHDRKTRRHYKLHRGGGEQGIKLYYDVDNLLNEQTEKLKNKLNYLSYVLYSYKEDPTRYNLQKDILVPINDMFGVIKKLATYISDFNEMYGKDKILIPLIKKWNIHIRNLEEYKKKLILLKARADNLYF